MPKKFVYKVDWLLFFSVSFIALAGLITMKSFLPFSINEFSFEFSFKENFYSNIFFYKQIIFLFLSLIIFFVFPLFDFRFLKRADFLVSIFFLSSVILLLIFAIGKISHGAKSWIDFGAFFFQPVDIIKLVLILILAKYFSRRHVEIKNIKHIFISGFYALVPFILVLLQPDLGSAAIIFLIWFGIVLVSGISKKHLLLVLVSGVLIFIYLWSFVFAPYQKNRIKNFLNPTSNLQTSGYNAFQSTIAVGSGQILGMGVGFGTQSRLKFLPEPQSDFIFAAFAEEWGFAGSSIILILFGLIIWRILSISALGASNFEVLFGVGLSIMLITHIIINIGMNLGILPITGIPLPFMSYGGSHILTEFIGLGILMSMRKYARRAHPDQIKNEFLGI